MKLFPFALVTVIVLVISVYAQTSLSLWPYYVEVEPQGGGGQLYDLVVPLPVMDKARADLADLRLFDSARFLMQSESEEMLTKNERSPRVCSITALLVHRRARFL
jgi:hypothetical protein